MSIQVAILKILASHVSGRATLSSLKHDLAILASSGADWQARIKRLAARVPELDIFSNGYVLRDPAGWEITQAGREFLNGLEAVTQDNLAPSPPEPVIRPPGTLIVVGHRFRNRTRQPDDAAHSVSGRRHRPRSEPH